MPLIETVERKLRGWNGKMISRGGRLQLVKSVMSTVPIYHMSCFKLPKWVIRRLDRIRRSFLWGKTRSEKKGLSLINWEVAYIPHCWGGLGISDLNWVNISLLLRWWWRAYADKDGLWSVTIRRLRRRNVQQEGPIIWLVTSSFFWRQLNGIKHLFNWCTNWSIGEGNAISFWFDV